MSIWKVPRRLALLSRYLRLIAIVAYSLSTKRATAKYQISITHCTYPTANSPSHLQIMEGRCVGSAHQDLKPLMLDSSLSQECHVSLSIQPLSRTGQVNNLWRADTVSLFPQTRLVFPRRGTIGVERCDPSSRVRFVTADSGFPYLVTHRASANNMFSSLS